MNLSLGDEQKLTGFYNLWNIKNELNSFFYDMVIIWTEAYANNTSIQIPIKDRPVIVPFKCGGFLSKA